VANVPLVAAGALALSVVVAAGGYLSGKTARDSRARVADFREAGAMDEAPSVGTMQAQAQAQTDPTKFAELVAEDASRLGVADNKVTTLAEVQPYVVVIDEPTVLGKGKGISGNGLKLSASTEKVTYSDHGASVSAKHAVLTVTNVGDKPLAYRLVAMSAGAETCEVRGARMHNAMALMPNESAEVVVCAGTSRIKVDKLEVLAVSGLGYHYVSQLPPRAVGYDAITERAHRPNTPVKTCALDSPAVAGWIADGRTTWADVVDFYSRHNCHRYAFFPEYERPQAPLDRLPVTPP
jgi:hypothetical protein